MLQILQLVMQFAEIAASRNRLVEHRQPGHLSDVLAEVADRDSLGDGDVALVRCFFPNDHAEEGGLPGPVRANQAGLLTRIELETGLYEQDLAPVLLADVGERDHERRSLADAVGHRTGDPLSRILVNLPPASTTSGTLSGGFVLCHSRWKMTTHRHSLLAPPRRRSIVARPSSRRTLRLVCASTIMFLVTSVMVPPLVSAGPNAGGALVLALNPNVSYSTIPLETYCASMTLDTCESAITDVGDGSEDILALIHVFGAFPPGSSPRVAAAVFGIDYTAGAGFTFGAYGHCGFWELPHGPWPGPDTQTAVVWDEAQTGLTLEIYWFGAYAYASYGAGTLETISGPVAGSHFTDDAIPASLDYVAFYGSFGFGGATGTLPCPPHGGCCLPDGSCVDVGPEVCAELTGDYLGDGSECDPGACGPVPTRSTTWGRIKDSLR